MLIKTLYGVGRILIPERFKPKAYRLYFMLDDYLHYGTADFFHLVEIETTTVCNLRCSYCPNSKFDRSLVQNKKEMKTELFYKIIDELSDIGYRGRVSPHFYGEPLMDKRLPKLIGYARKKLPSAKIVLFTNGELLTVSLYQKLVQAGVDRFIIRQHLKEKSKNVMDVMDYRARYGDDGVKLDYLKPLRPEELQNRGGLIDAKKLTLASCLIPGESITIDHAGNVLPCCQDYFSTVTFGNVNNETLLQIWNKHYSKKIRNELKKGVFRLDICKKCTETSGRE